MFTGIITAVGRIKEVILTAKDTSANNKIFWIETPYSKFDLKIGESIAVNGACLTVTNILGDTPQKSELEFYASEETLQKTNLNSLKFGDLVNLEQAMILGDRLSGHIVQGHVDGLAKLKSITALGDSKILEVEVPKHLLRYMISKGSVTIDGISLTINSIDNSCIYLNIIPHTWENTNLHTWYTTQDLNLEVDVIAKYTETLLIHKNS